MIFEVPSLPAPSPMDAALSFSEDALLAQLNPEQLAAVTLAQGHALILAGAGSGKTRVLTTRIAWLLAQHMAQPGSILAVTFTNKAAKEMLARLSALLPAHLHVNPRTMWIGTFHGLCHRLLRVHHQAAGLPQSFQILDMQDQLSAIKRLCKQFQVDEERYPPKELQYFIAGCKEQGQRPRDIAVSAYNEEGRKKVELYQLYEQQCQREGVVDFGELMLRSYELLRDNDPLRAHYQRRFSHILIDEFQDTNRLQYLWLKQIAGEEVNGYITTHSDTTSSSVMAVGDDDQSIYAFRGARVGNMQDFVREFSVRHTIKLEHNYRSHSHILNCANILIGNNQGRLGKNLRTDQGPGELVRIFQGHNDFEEARLVVEEIAHLLATHRGIQRRDIAILYRSNAQSRVLESQLSNAGIAYRVYGGMRFFERAEIKHALAYLRLIENPQDDTSFLRAVNFPSRGIGARTLELLQDSARQRHCALHEVLSHIPGAAGVKLGQFANLMHTLRNQTQGQSLRVTIEWMLQTSGLIAHYRNEKEGQDRIDNLEELIHAAQSFVTQEGFGREATAAPDTGETLSPLAAFLSHAALEAGDHQAQAGDDAVQLMTVHASKGLEFDAVFITGLEEELFPHASAASDRAALEEERRLMYVAITRARQRLYIGHAQTRMLHGQTRHNPPSRFLDELPATAIKRLMPYAAHTSQPSGFRNFASNSGAASAYSARPVGHTGHAVPSHTAVAAGGTKQASGLYVGQSVFHAKFGQGQVRALEGTGDDARAQIDFSRHGTKWLALAVAKLTAA